MSRTALFERLAGTGAIVVTPNRRLARALARDFDAWQLRRGLKAWETPLILPFNAVVARWHEMAQHDPALSGVRAPLSAAQERAVWESVVDASDVALASTARAAALAADAWSLAHQWRIAAALRTYALTEDTRVFAAWSEDYAQRVERMGATDQARLPDLVTALITERRLTVDASIVLAGFDELTPQQDALFTAVRAAGAVVDRLPDDRPVGACRLFAAVDEHAELDRMADWVAARFAADPGVRIGLIVPDLSARRRAVARALDATLMPDALLAPPDRLRPYTISLGEALAEAPLVATALRLLRLAIAAIDVEEASAVLRSGHLDFGAAAERARFDLDVRERTGRFVSLDQLLKAARRPRREGSSSPRAALEALQRWRVRAGTGKRRASEWAALLQDALRAVGFPGPASLDSSEYQTLARWQELLAEFASIDRVAGPLDLPGALERLGRLAAETIFQPEGGDPPVQVLGLLEATGLEFDHLWIAGMTAEAWPPSARPHPLLPLELQRARRMPGALVEVELQRAQATLERLARAAPEVVASHATGDGERRVMPAPMVAAWPSADPWPVARRAVDVLAPAPLEVQVDARAPALSAAYVVGGGAGTLTDQAACPFRAFARHRLKSGEPKAPHDGLAASERGELVHRTLAAFWQALPQRTRSHVAGMPAAALDAAVEKAAETAIATLRERRIDDPGGGLLALERRRLVDLVSAWLRDEVAQRDEFEVSGIEERRSLAIGRLSLRGRLDRVDRLPDGRTLVIDYKTGGPTSVRAWLGPRPDEPQLPLYLVASETDASAVAFARIRAGERRFVALAAEPALLPDASVDWQREFPSWPALVDAWRTELTRLADAFADGVAEVDPKRADTCRYCDVALLCRRDERLGVAADDDAGGSDDE